MAREFSKVGVVGLGTMGAGIVEVFARAGLSVVGVEPTEDALARGRGHLERSTGRAVERGRLSEEDQRALLGRVTLTTSLEELADADLVLEAVPELLDVKQEIFATLDKTCAPETVLATNTSSLSVTSLAAGTSRSRQVVGMHFFNPAPVLKLVEVVRTVVADADVVDDVAGLARRIGKVPVVVGDRAGFVGNALLFGYLNAAVRMYEEGFASRADIDAAMTLGAGLPMGPFALLDLIGLDTAYEILETMYAQARNRLYAPAPLLRQMVAVGLRGRKSGRGFYAYAAPGSPEVVQEEHAEAPAPVAGRAVERVGVVGTGPRAERIAEAYRAAGYGVVHVLAEEDEAAPVMVPDADRLADRDLLVEAVTDELAVKQRVMAALDAVARPGAVLATSATSVPVVDLAAATGRPGDVVGLHAVAHVGGPGVVEVVRTVATSPEVVATAAAVAERLGARAVVCADRAGFVVAALLYPYLNDAVRMVETHYASADDIDTAMKVGCSYPQGPFEVLESVGLAHALAVLRRLYREFREPGYAPAPLLEQLVTVGADASALRRLGGN